MIMNAAIPLTEPPTHARLCIKFRLFFSIHPRFNRMLRHARFYFYATSSHKKLCSKLTTTFRFIVAIKNGEVFLNVNLAFSHS